MPVKIDESDSPADFENSPGELVTLFCSAHSGQIVITKCVKNKNITKQIPDFKGHDTSWRVQFILHEWVWTVPIYQLIDILTIYANPYMGMQDSFHLWNTNQIKDIFTHKYISITIKDCDWINKC